MKQTVGCSLKSHHWIVGFTLSQPCYLMLCYRPTLMYDLICIPKAAADHLDPNCHTTEIAITTTICNHILKTESSDDHANFVVTGGTYGCCYDNPLWQPPCCHKWQSWHYDNISWSSVNLFLDSKDPWINIDWHFHVGSKSKWCQFEGCPFIQKYRCLISDKMMTKFGSTMYIYDLVQDLH